MEFVGNTGDYGRYTRVPVECNEIMAKTITVEELQANPIKAMEGADGEPVAVMNGGFLLYYLESSVKRRIANKELDGRQKPNGDYAIDPDELRKVFADA